MREFSQFRLVRESSVLRRAGLLEVMDELKASSVGCANCPGTCCTFVANSMQITPIEALDIFSYLKEKGHLNDELWIKLEANVKDFRLLSGPHVGAGRAFRRTYTCPFFAGTQLGCTISPEAKPYGCLAFNPAEQLENSGKSCGSDLDLLESRELAMGTSEEEVNILIRKELSIPWLKESIPVALLDIRDRLIALAP